MKRVKLCDTACIELSEEQFNNTKTVNMMAEKTNEVLYQAKEIYLQRNMVLLVPLSEFEDVEG